MSTRIIRDTSMNARRHAAAATIGRGLLPSVSAVRSAARRGRRGEGWADDMLFAGAVVPTILGSGVGARSA